MFHDNKNKITFEGFVREIKSVDTANAEYRIVREKKAFHHAQNRVKNIQELLSRLQVISNEISNLTTACVQEKDSDEKNRLKLKINKKLMNSKKLKEKMIMIEKKFDNWCDKCAHQKKKSEEMQKLQRKRMELVRKIHIKMHEIDEIVKPLIDHLYHKITGM